MVVRVGYDAAHSGMNQGWLFGFWGDFFFWIKLPMPDRIHSEMNEVVLEALILKKAEGSFCSVGSETPPVSFDITNYSIKWYIWGCFQFDLNFDTDQQVIRKAQGR